MDIQSDDDQALKYVSGRRTRTAAVTTIPSWGSKEILCAASQVLFIAEHFQLGRRIVVASDIADGFSGITGIAMRLGIEFMTLQQFIDFRKSED